LNQDPLGFGGEDTNLYRYTFNAPTQYSDPSGEGINFGFALGGFVIGALVGGGMALLQGQGIGGVLAGAGKGALVGGVAGLTFGASLAVGAAATSAAGITGGFAATAAGVTTNAVAGIVSGQVGHATANLLNGESVTSGLGQPGEMATDAALGVVAPPVLRGVRWIGGRFWRFLRRGAPKFTRVPATQELADEIAAVGLPRSKQTVVLIETKEGPTIGTCLAGLYSSLYSSRPSYFTWFYR
jgi:hypothetical protein